MKLDHEIREILDECRRYLEVPVDTKTILALIARIDAILDTPESKGLDTFRNPM